MKCQPPVTQKVFYLLYANNRRKCPVFAPIHQAVVPLCPCAPEHGRMDSDAAMVCSKRIPGYDWPYRPGHEPTPYEYYDPDAPRTEGL